MSSLPGGLQGTADTCQPPPKERASAHGSTAQGRDRAQGAKLPAVPSFIVPERSWMEGQRAALLREEVQLLPEDLCLNLLGQASPTGPGLETPHKVAAIAGNDVFLWGAADEAPFF